MIDVDEAQRILLDNVSVGPTETVDLRDGLHRTLAEPVRCDLDFPPFDRSVMDGFAVRANDTSQPPVDLNVIGQIAAGATATSTIGPGQSMQINTGAPIPSGADAVVRVESTTRSDDGSLVTVHSGVSSGTFITPRGKYVTAGQVVVPSQVRMTALEMSAAAAAGVTHICVYRRPKIAILVSGDELVEIDQKPDEAQIRDSNRYLLDALLRSVQAEPILLGVVGDDKAKLRAKIEEGLAADMLCITGGISLGEFDFVPEVLSVCQAHVHIHKMAIKPGRPTIFATGPQGTPIFALSGNPGSALIGFELLVKPAIAAWQGRTGHSSPWVQATLRGTLRATSDRRTFSPARWKTDDDARLAVEPVPWNGSGDTFGWVTADALIMLPPHSSQVPDGGTVLAMRLGSE